MQLIERHNAPSCSTESIVTGLIDQAKQTGPRGTRAAAQLISAVVADPQAELELLAQSGDWPPPRLILGITGAAGAGKSTLTSHLIDEFRRRAPQRRIGVVAVDPSSPHTHGALLGDRVRMMKHATDPNVFIRSLATRGHAGGLARGVPGVIRIFSLIGCDVVIVETVGVGQCELDVARCTDLVLVVFAPGQGDEIQMLKAGLVDIGNIFVVSKADCAGAARLHHELLSALQLRATARAGSDAIVAPSDVVLWSSANAESTRQLVDLLEARITRECSAWQVRRRTQLTEEFRALLLEQVRGRAEQALEQGDGVCTAVQRMQSGESLERLARDLLSQATAQEMKRS